MSIYDIREAADFKFKIPRPPSVNNLFPSGKSGKRFLSKNYKEWLKLMDRLTGLAPIFVSKKRVKTQINEYPPARIESGFFRAVIKVERIKNNVGDVESYAKAIMDYFVSRGILPDDRFCDSIILAYFNDRRKGDYCYVYFKKVTEQKEDPIQPALI